MIGPDSNGTPLQQFLRDNMAHTSDVRDNAAYTEDRRNHLLAVFRREHDGAIPQRLLPDRPAGEKPADPRSCEPQYGQFIDSPGVKWVP